MSVLRRRTYVQQDPSSAVGVIAYDAVYAEHVTHVTSLEV